MTNLNEQYTLSHNLQEMLSALSDDEGNDESPLLPLNYVCDYTMPTDFTGLSSSNTDLSFFHLNVRGLSANWEQFKHLVSDLHSGPSGFDFIGISESFKCDHDNRIQLPGYHNPLAKQRTRDFRGGVALFIK